jgi:hypothetical protein
MTETINVISTPVEFPPLRCVLNEPLRDIHDAVLKVRKR